VSVRESRVGFRFGMSARRMVPGRPASERRRSVATGRAERGPWLMSFRNQNRPGGAEECSRGWNEAEPVDGSESSLDPAPNGGRGAGAHRVRPSMDDMLETFGRRWRSPVPCITEQPAQLEEMESPRYTHGSRGAVGGRGAVLPVVGSERGGRV